MSFGNRVATATAAAVAVAIIVASSLVYVAARNEQLRQVDQAMLERASSLRALGYPTEHGTFELPPPPRLGAAGGYTQYVTSSGAVLLGPSDTDVVPVSESARAVAAGDAQTVVENAEVEGTHVRVLTMAIVPGVAVQVARPLNEVDEVLSRLRLVLLLIALGGIALASSLGMLVARTVLAPVEALTDAAERIARTRDPSEHIDIKGHDELGRLADSFNMMLEALDDALRSQRRLVADASHELRTPLTSLRTNIEVLARADGMPAADREQLLADVTAQLQDLTVLVGDLVELARGDEEGTEQEALRLDEIVERAVARAQTHWPSVRFSTDLQPSTLEGYATRLARAYANLLDNAGKWSPAGSTVEVTLNATGALRVRDHGPGVAEEDRERIFDRFYRAPGARALPGSGLGLAIVRQVAQDHGGSVDATNAEDGGAVFTMRLPGKPAADETPPDETAAREAERTP